MKSSLILKYTQFKDKHPKVKKHIIITIGIIISIIAALASNNNVFLIDSKNAIGILLGILALLFTSISMIINFINGKFKNVGWPISKAQEVKNKLYESLKADFNKVISSIFILIILNVILYFNFPYVHDIIFTYWAGAISLKSFILNIIISYVVFTSLVASMDIIKSTLTLIFI